MTVTWCRSTAWSTVQPRTSTRTLGRAARKLVYAVAGMATLLTPVEPLAQDAAPTGVVHGFVRSEASGRPLPATVVELRNGDAVARAFADSTGRYSVLTVQPGRNVLRATQIGHWTLELEVVVPARGELALDLTLSSRPVPLDAIVAQVDGTTAADTLASPESELGLVGARALQSSPGLAEAGIADAVRGIPGKEPTDPGSVLYVRGAAADLKLVSLDGAPVYAPFPLGGLLEPFSPGVLNRADVYLGGAPARYDGGLSYVMDLRTRSAVRSGSRVSGALDLLSGRVLAEAGVGERIGVLASARGIHPIASEILGSTLPYGYREGLIRSDVVFDENAILGLTGFFNEEVVRMGGAPPADSVIRWGNVAGSVRFEALWGATRIELTAAAGDYSASLPLTGVRPIVADALARRTRFSADFSRNGDFDIHYGLSLDRQSYRATATDSLTRTGVVEGSGDALGAYAELASQVGERVRLRGGARVDRFSTGDLAFAPRLAATWFITDRAAMTLAAGTYHQFLRPPDEVLLSRPTEMLTAVAPLAVGRASHFTASLDQEIGEGMRLGIEGFFKEFSNVPGSLSMEANASGVDFWVRRESETWGGWLGYSLAWVWSRGVEDEHLDFSGRHLLSAGVQTTWGDRTHIDLRFAYGAGLPYSGIPLAHPDRFSSVGTVENSFETNTPSLSSAQRGGTETAPLLYTPESPFIRLDASISQDWSPRWGEHLVHVTPYFKLLNGLGRRDALFYFVDNDENNEGRTIGALPVLPVAGLEVRF